MLQEKLYQLALGMIPGIGSVYTRALISHFGSAERVFQIPKGKLLQVPGIGRVLAEALSNTREALMKAESQLAKAEKEHVRLLFYTEPEYPARLKEVADAPVLLFVKGNVDMNISRTVAIVGTRSATAYGRDQTDKLVRELLPWSPLIVSGLAYGIDICAHQSALHYGLPTLGVMASGMDYIYPALHKETARKMLQNGGLATEYVFGTMPETPFFPARNRIVAALSDVTVVVEAAERGGALITAELANSYNREIFALPGNVDQSHSKGCLNLIRDHKAHILTDTNDLIKLMSWDQPAKKKAVHIIPEHLSETEKQILNVLHDQGELQIDDLSWKASVPLNRLAGLLLQLEMEGLVKALPGKRFKKIG